MFEQAVLSSGPAAKRVWTTSIGLVGQAVAVGSLVLLSVVWPQALPIATILTKLEAPGPPPAPQPPGTFVKPHGTVRNPIQVLRLDAFYAPTIVPPHPQIIEDAVPDTAGPGVIGAIYVPGATGGGGVGQLMSDILGQQAPPPRPVETVRVEPPKPQPTAAPRMIRASDLRLAKLIHKVEPVYPQLAKQARIQGTVQVEAIIAVDGHMRDVRAVSGHPLLIAAAIDAVRQWIYEPTVLNGGKVEVIAPITVNFRLNR
jgi:protein TonB